MSVDESTNTVLLTPVELDWERSRHDEIGAESPFLIKHNGYYYLSYSTNDFRNKDYFLGYAVSKSPLGPYKKHEKLLLERR